MQDRNQTIDYTKKLITISLSGFRYPRHFRTINSFIYFSVTIIVYYSISTNFITDNGATFGPMLMLATNGTIGEAAEEETEEG